MSDLRERNRLSVALNDIDARIHSNLGVEAVLQSALDGFVEALGADAGDIKVRDGEQWVVSYQCGIGEDVVGLRLAVEDAPVAVEATRSREPVAIPDVTERPDLWRGFPRRYGLRATLGIPLVVRGEIVGCLLAWMRSGPRVFSRGEIDFARRMAASVALAIENARLFEVAETARVDAQEAERRLEQELQRTRILLKASDELTSATDTDELSLRLANVVLEATGIHRTFVNLIDQHDRTLTPKVATGGLFEPRGTVIPFERLSSISLDAIARKQTTLLDYESPDTSAADRAIAKSNRARLVLFVPLVHRDEVIGHIALDQPGERYAFTPEQIRIVDSIAAQASVALQNARMYEREHRIAQTLQQAILASPAQIDGLEVACLYHPASSAADVGGDFYDVLDLGDGRVALLIGDVSGKGIEAAQLTTLVRDGSRAYLHEKCDPGDVMTRLNSMTCRFTAPEKFATAFLGVLDRATGAFVYSGGGHPAPAVVGPGGVRLLEPPAGLIGALEQTRFESRSDKLAPDEVLVLVTDGVTEARRDMQFFGEEGLSAGLERLAGTRVADLPGRLLAEVLEFADGRLRDDVAIMCVGRTADGSGS